jgi:hypothetical protein
MVSVLIQATLLYHLNQIAPAITDTPWFRYCMRVLSVAAMRTARGAKQEEVAPLGQALPREHLGNTVLPIADPIWEDLDSAAQEIAKGIF